MTALGDQLTVEEDQLKSCAEDLAGALMDDRCGQMASDRFELGLAGCEAGESQLELLLSEEEALERLEPEARQYFGEFQILCFPEC